MATKVAHAPASGTAHDAATDSPPKPRGFLAKKRRIVVLLLIVTSLQTTALYFLLPSPADPAAPRSLGTDAAAGTETDPNAADVDAAEVAIDSFQCTNSRAVPGTDLQVTFKLSALVSRENEVPFDEAANTLYRAWIRQSIVKAVRSLSLDDLNDPSRGTMKRLLREEINKILRNGYVLGVVISDVAVSHHERAKP